MLNRTVFLFAVCLLLIQLSLSAEPKKKKDVRDFTDADLDRLYDEWEENDDDELEEDEKPGYRPKMSDNEFNDALKSAKSPEDALKLTKRGQPVMMFVSVTNPSGEAVTKPFMEGITSRWQGSLFNNHIDVQVYPVDDDRSIFMFKDGSQAFEAKQFILKQSECLEITLEGKSENGVGYKKNSADEL